MDGGDISAIQLLQSHKQTPNPQPPLQWINSGHAPVLKHGIRHCGRCADLDPFQAGKGLLQTLTDPGAQFLCGRIGVGDHQQLLEGVTRLRDQSKREMGECKGLAGAGTGFKQTQAGFEGVGVGVKALRHRSRLQRFHRAVAGWRC